MIYQLLYWWNKVQNLESYYKLLCMAFKLNHVHNALDFGLNVFTNTHWAFSFLVKNQNYNSKNFCESFLIKILMLFKTKIIKRLFFSLRRRGLLISIWNFMNTHFHHKRNFVENADSMEEAEKQIARYFNGRHRKMSL